ncbi:MAG: SDR family NAD(P)-dependent oxidoreductase [Phycisphaeraceae bacterium]|nr:SDR family NAD(P)-dependent oxidoreductase [Phycisphaeraceae bacterium]
MKPVALAIAEFGGIDALLNNAGYGAYGPLEAFPMDGIRRQWDTNVLGLLAVTKAVLPHMRQNKTGVIANVSSVGGKLTFPLGTLYHGTKWAVEGLTESLHYELAPLGIRVKIIEPGAIATDFGGRSFDFTNDESLSEYQPTVQAMLSAIENVFTTSSPAADCAVVIYDAITDGSEKMRYPAAGGAEEMLAMREGATDENYFAQVKAMMGS